MRVSLLFLFVSILFGTCKEKDDSATPNPYAAKILAQLNPTDSFLYDQYKYPNKRVDSMLVEEGKRNQKHLGLESLERGFDSIQIRIGFEYSLSNEYLLLLKNDREKWSAELCTLKGIHTADYDSLTGVKKDCRNRRPKSGWVKFIDSLFSLQILTLPDYHNIPAYSEDMPTDVTGVTVELATKNVYRLYDLFEPWHMKDKFWQADKMNAIIRLIDEEFDVKLFQIKNVKQSARKPKNDTIKVHEIELQDLKQDTAK